MKRRQFLGQTLQIAAYLGSFASCALMTTSAQSRGMAGRAQTWLRLADCLVAALPHRQEASRIGRAQLRNLQEKIHPADLVDEIMTELGMCSRAVERVKSGELRAMFQAKNKAEFAANHTVLVNGWVFGSTETRLFCLAALT